MKSLKYIRIVIAILSLLAITFLFLDVSDFAANNLDFMAKVQLVPALLALNFAAIVFLVLLTLIFGRVYCSVICPLGIFQDIIGRCRKIVAGKKKRKVGVFRYSKPFTKTRMVFLGLFLVVIILGALNLMAVSLGAIIEPYSAFGRMVTALVSPIYDAGNNYLADMSADAGDFEFTPVSRVVPAILFVIASITFVVVTIMAFTNGRIYCNSVCPVGTVLGYASRLSLLKPRIDETKCNGCGSCQRHCKSKCIDSKNHAIDYTRCVDCFDCINVCNKGALKYALAAKKSPTTAPKPVDNTKRAFIASVGVLAGTLAAKSAGNVLDKVTDGGLTPLKNRDKTRRAVPILPPGVLSQARLNLHCVGCQLCVQACPNGVLSMSTDFSTLMQPVVNYDKTYCLPECAKCSNVCPTDAFRPLDVVLKSSWKIGTATVNPDLCLWATGTDSCGNCARHCPAGAIDMVLTAEGDDENIARYMPVVNENICIGCGACEVHCPVGTVASMSSTQPAIVVEGITLQRTV